MDMTLSRLTRGYGAWRWLGKMLLLLTLCPAWAEAAPLKLVAIGDSLTAGYGLAEGEGFVPQLDAWLEANDPRDVEVVNMGISGDTTAGGLARLDWALGGGADAVLVELGGNDLLRGIDPAVSRRNLDGLVGGLAERGLPVLISGMRAPGNFGPEYQQAFNAMYPELAEAHDALYDPYFLEGVTEDRSLWQADGIHPNAAGIAVIVARIGPRIVELLDRIE
ncbi:MAG: arylesterase [Pseudomonadota bacterium]